MRLEGIGLGLDRGCRSSSDATSKSWAHGTAAAALVLAGSISLGWVFRRPWFEGNLAVVDPDRVIRSAQPTRQLGRWIDDFHLRSILNLRGGSRADWWYDTEVAVAEARGVAFYDLPLSATRRPTRRELLFLIDVLERCPYPLLIHCKSGADRTGLASALYLMVKRNQPPDLAENAFALEFRPRPVPRHRASARAASRIRRLAAGSPAGSFTKVAPRLGQDRVPIGRSFGRPAPVAAGTPAVKHQIRNHNRYEQIRNPKREGNPVPIWDLMLVI